MSVMSDQAYQRIVEQHRRPDAERLDRLRCEQIEIQQRTIDMLERALSQVELALADPRADRAAGGRCTP